MNRSSVLYRTDSYKVSHWLQFPEGAKRTFYYIESRGGGRERKFISGHNGRKYKNKKDYKTVWYSKAKTDPEYRKKKTQNKAKRGRDLKAQLLMNKGGKCSACGLLYDGTNACVFDFHHIDPTLKLFNVNVGTFNIHSISVINEEADKCIILCSNCHRLTHREMEY